MSGSHETNPTPDPPEPALPWTQRSGLEALSIWVDRHRRWIPVVILALYAAGLTSHWRMMPDNAGYLYLARQLAEGADYVHPSGLHGNVAPGFPHLLSWPLRLFGSDAFFAVNAMTLGIALASLALAYWLFHLHAGRRAANMALLMLAITETWYIAAFEPMADLPFMTGMLLMLVGLERLYQRRPARLGSVALVLAGIVVMGLMRNVVLTAIGGLTVGLVWQVLRSGRWTVLLLVFGAVGVGLIVVRLADPNVHGLELTNDEQILIQLLTTELPETLHRATTTNLYLLFCETASRTALGADFGAWINLPFGIAFMLAGLAMFRRRPVWGGLVAVFAVQWLIFFVDRRYFLPILPIFVYGTWWALSTADRRAAGRAYGAWFPVLFAMWIGLNLARIGTIVIEQHHPETLGMLDGGRYASLDRMAVEIGTYTPADAVLLADPWFSGPLSYWTRRRTEQVVSDSCVAAEDLFVITPLEPEAAEGVRIRSWSFGPPLATIERVGHEEPLVLRRVVRP